MKWTKAKDDTPPANRWIVFKEEDGSYSIDLSTRWDKDVINYEWADLEDESEITEEEKDNFAISFAVWYAHAEDAQVYKSQHLPASQMLALYKSRPFLRTDSPESN